MSEEKPKAGYLVMRLRPGEGFTVNQEIEVRVAHKAECPICKGETQVAIKAPKEQPIRRVT